MKQILSDRVNVKLTVGKNMEMVGDPHYLVMPLTILPRTIKVTTPIPTVPRDETSTTLDIFGGRLDGV
jgi:hypothetical protein